MDEEDTTPPSLKSLRNEMMVELLTGDAMIRGITDLGYGLLQDLEGTPDEYKTWANTAYRRGMVSLALHYLNKYIQARAGIGGDLEPDILNQKGLCELRLGDLKEALADLTAAVNSDADRADFHNNRGLALFELMQFEQALQEFSRGWEIDPNYAEAAWNLAITWMKLENAQEALKFLREAIELDEHFRWKAHESEDFSILVENSDFHELMCPLEPAAREFADWGRSAFEQGDFSMANYYFTKYLQDTPGDADILNLRGRALVNLEFYQQAIEMFNHAIEVDPQPKYYTNLGIAYFFLKDYDRAIESYNAAIQRSSRFATAYWLKALTEITCGRTAPTLSALKHLLQVDSTYREKIREHPAFVTLHQDPEFQDLLETN